MEQQQKQTRTTAPAKQKRTGTGTMGVTGKMATEGQIAALGNWLKVAVSEELQFDMASSALARLHEASEKFNVNKGKNKGIVSATKKEIIKELRQTGYLIEDKDQERIEVERMPEGQALDGIISEQEEKEIWEKKPEEEPVDMPMYEQSIIDEVAIKLSACTQKAKQSIESDYNDLDLTDDQNARMRKEIAATILIQATRGGL